jgi:hypothetical protein
MSFHRVDRWIDADVDEYRADESVKLRRRLLKVRHGPHRHSVSTQSPCNVCKVRPVVEGVSRVVAELLELHMLYPIRAVVDNDKGKGES